MRKWAGTVLDYHGVQKVLVKGQVGGCLAWSRDLTVPTVGCRHHLCVCVVTCSWVAGLVAESPLGLSLPGHKAKGLDQLGI